MSGISDSNKTDPNDYPYAVITSGDGLPVQTETGSSDAVLASLLGLVTKARTMIFNGTTWDRARTANIGNNVDATGMPIAAGYSQYRAPSTATLNKFTLNPSDQFGVPIATTNIQNHTLLQMSFATSTGINSVAASAETAYFLLKNPTGSNKVLRLFLMRIGHQATTASTTMAYRLYANPTITANGTALTIVNQRIVSGASATAMQAFRSPTISANGSLMTEFMTFGQTPFPEINFPHYIAIDANNSVLVTVQSSGLNVPSAVSAVWAET